VGGGGGRVEGREGCCCHLRGLLSGLGLREDGNIGFLVGFIEGEGFLGSRAVD